MRQTRGWAQSSVWLIIFLLWLLGFTWVRSHQWLPALWSNLGYIHRNQALWATAVSTPVLPNQRLGQAIQLLARSGKFNECNPLGFLSSFVVPCARVNEWPSEIITLADNKPYRAFFVPVEARSIKYRQVFTLLLPDEFVNLNTLTLLTATGNSTRIEQGMRIAYAVVITAEDAYLLSLHAGIETAEWAYDFPDVQPQHHKPPNSYKLTNGGDAYPATITFEKPVSPIAITLVFSNPQHWPFQPGVWLEPGLTVWAVGIETANESVGVEQSSLILQEKT